MDQARTSQVRELPIPKPQTTRFETLSTERGELEYFAHAAAERRSLALPGGDEQHGVSVFEAILASAKQGQSMAVR